ncbi:class II aldolase/adducin family protein, partial [Mycetocola sp.]|uniref:class II aldolase/adducin family protein n=1 Tax=Mycetocola sp. TaxID=1871042 RepID=UPI0026121B70
MKALNPLDEITRISRQLGADPALVLHGGGNTSIKGTVRDVTGEDVEVVWVKGSGWDLGTIEPAGFAPLRRTRLLRVLDVETLSDAQMVNEVRQASLDASAPTASIEALLHAFIPHRVVLHSHADAIVALTNQPSSADTVAEVLGDRVMVLPYVMPGFDLARMVAGVGAELTDGSVDALVLSNHGLFTFADDADTAYRRHLDLVDRASQELGVTEWGATGPLFAARPGALRDIAALRRDLSTAAGCPMIVRQSDSSRAALFAARPDVVAATSRGTATPEHIIRTKRVPLVGRNVAAYVADYRGYFGENRDRFEALTELDPAPRV